MSVTREWHELDVGLGLREVRETRGLDQHVVGASRSSTSMRLAGERRRRNFPAGSRCSKLSKTSRIFYVVTYRLGVVKQRSAQESCSAIASRALPPRTGQRHDLGGSNSPHCLGQPAATTHETRPPTQQ